MTLLPSYTPGMPTVYSSGLNSPILGTTGLQHNRFDLVRPLGSQRSVLVTETDTPAHSRP